jgi:hypothetical protein
VSQRAFKCLLDYHSHGCVANMASTSYDKPIWLTFDLVIALILTITNTVAFSRCDKFSQASNLASSALYSGGIARSVATGMFSRLFSR